MERANGFLGFLKPNMQIDKNQYSSWVVVVGFFVSFEILKFFYYIWIGP